MISIDDQYEDLYEINKSKFYAFAFPVFQDEQAKEILNNLSKDYRDATHICYAYILSSPRVEKSSDDGEPAGTAGKPLLELLKKKGLENVMVVVVRYFGGIKLGAGGLIRAYTSAGNMVISRAKTVCYLEVNKYRIVVPTQDGKKVESIIHRLGGEVVSITYLDNTIIEFVGDISEQLDSMTGYKPINIGSERVCQ